MTSPSARLLTAVWLLVMGCDAGVVRAEPAQWATLTPANAEGLAPAGNESDWIYGDVVLFDDRHVAVIARPVPGRHANWVLRDAGCSVIDFTQRSEPRDALGLFRPAGPGVAFGPAPGQSLDLALGPAGEFGCVSPQQPGQPRIELRYRLLPDHLEVTTRYSNRGDGPLEFELQDQLRAEETFEKPGDRSGEGRGPFFWAYDRHARQAFGVAALGRPIRFTSDWRNTQLRYSRGQPGPVVLSPGENFELVRRFFVADDLLALRERADEARGETLHPVAVVVSDPTGPVGGADLLLLDAKGRRVAAGRTDGRGRRTLKLAAGRYGLLVEGPGRPALRSSFEAPAAEPLAVALEAPGVVELELIDGIGERIPAKLQFLGVDGTPSPDFGPAQGEHALRNVYNTHDGRVRRELLPGRYRLVASRGPEYDAVQQLVEVVAGETQRLQLRLRRSVDTRGWVSTDLHTHSTESGDTTSSVRGRVLNLLAEHIEFAPSTEHNRISDYRPHLVALGSEGAMGTSPGVELTGDFPMNHQNAFPLRLHARTQDGGAPLSAGLEAQVRRLREHDGASEKLVQQNHPDFFQLLYDRDRDGRADGGYSGALAEIDALEVYPLAAFLNEEHGDERDSRLLLWMQLLNRGERIPGVVNTDAHSNFHGAGPRRTYVRSSTDHPGAIDPLEIVRELKRGHAVMTTGPFLEVAMEASGRNERPAFPGDDLSAPGGAAELTIRVQCPNWFDIDRVQVLLNGRPAPDLNFTRETTPRRFSKAPVRFASVVRLSLEHDAHVIVVAAGQGSKLGLPMGQHNAGLMPIAVSNPIFVDVDGGGFQPNHDRLGVALPEGSAWPEAPAEASLVE